MKKTDKRIYIKYQESRRNNENVNLKIVKYNNKNILYYYNDSNIILKIEPI